MYFATAGVIDNEDANTRALEQRVVEDLNSLHIFSHVDFYLHDAIQLQQQYQRISHRNIREIEFPQHTLLPAINGIRQAFIGVIPVSQFLRLITDEDGQLNRRVFYDNIRD